MEAMAGSAHPNEDCANKAEPHGSVAYIGLGSNLDNRENSLRQAVRMLREHPAISVVRCSSLYETEPIGYVDQPAFLNMALRVVTTLEPEALLEQMLDIERRLGRVREIRYGPRTIDLDLLLYDNRAMETERLILPHPRMHERRFVLVPLSELLHHDPQPPEWGWVQEAIATDTGEGDVALWKKLNWLNEFELSAN